MDFSTNSFEGSIPSDFLAYSTETPIQVTKATISVSVNGNNLDGNLPESLFTALNWTSIGSFQLFLYDNLFTGGLPTNLLANSHTPDLTLLAIDLRRSRNMNGTIPASFFSSLSAIASKIPSGYPARSSPLQASLVISDTSLTGTLAIPNFGPRLANPPISLTILAERSNLQDLTIHPNASSSIRELIFTNSSQLKGSISSALFAPPSALVSLQAGNTSLSGPMPNMGILPPINLTAIDLSSTKIDFCGTPRTAWNAPLSSCNLARTSASQCKALYPSNCFIADTGGVPPVTAPSTPSTCPASTQPGPSFICVDGRWITTITVTTPVFTVPAGSTEVVVTNITSSSIVIQGVGSTLIINGCASNLTKVTIELTQEEVKKLGSKVVQQLIIANTSSSSCVNLGGVGVDLKVSGSGCRKVKVDKIVSATTLSAAFNISSSACNVWWIVLTSVLCALVLLGIIVGVVIHHYMRKKKFSSYRKDTAG